MNRQKIAKFFGENWSAKMLCVIAALSLWLFVSSTQNKIAKFPGSISIESINVPTNLVVVTDVKQVNIKLIADPTVWAKLSPESFAATVDLASMKQGTHQLPVNITCSVNGVQIVEQDPTYIFVTLEPVITKDVSVLKRVDGSAADGMVPGSIVFSPAQVQIRGAESEIKNVNEVVATIMLNGESTDFSRVVKPTVYDDKGQELSNVDIIPSQIESSISIVRGSNVKTVGVEVNIKGTVKDNYYISGITTAPGAVNITGVRDAVANTASIKTAIVDVSGTSQAVTKEVALVLPDGVTLLSGSTNTVQVTVTILPIQAPKDFMVSNFQTMSPKYTIISYSPASIKVAATAPISVLNGLSASDFAIVLDLTNQNPDSNGDLNLTLTKSNIRPPDGVIVTAIDPVSIKIKTH